MQRKPLTRVIGIDPGTGRLGWAILEGNASRYALLNCGCEETPKEWDPGRRLVAIAEKLEELIQTYKPQAGAVEQLYFATNAKTAMRVAEARGVVVVGLAKHQIPVFDYTPLQIKQSVTGYGKADKKQVQQMVKAILKLPTIIKPDDAADAVAVGLTYLFSSSLA